MRATARTFFKDLAWALANCGGIVRVIVAVRDWNVSPCVRTAECYPQKNLLMRITYLDPETGAFRLEQVAPTDTASVKGTPTSMQLLESLKGEGSRVVAAS